jgi:hypothetical protein
MHGAQIYWQPSFAATSVSVPTFARKIGLLVLQEKSAALPFSLETLNFVRCAGSNRPIVYRRNGQNLDVTRTIQPWTRPAAFFFVITLVSVYSKAHYTVRGAWR